MEARLTGPVAQLLAQLTGPNPPRWYNVLRIIFFTAFLLLIGQRTIGRLVYPAGIEVVGDFPLIVWEPARQIMTGVSVPTFYPYPLWTPVLMMPFALGTVQQGATVWLWVTLVLMAVSVVQLVRVLGWSIWAAPVFGLGMLFQDRVMVGVAAGQVIIVVVLLLILFFGALQRQHFGIAGMLLGATLIKPHPTILVSIGFLAWALYYRRWRLIGGYAAVAALFVALAAPFASTPMQIFGGGIGQHLTQGIGNGSTLWGLLLRVAPIQWWAVGALCAALVAWLAHWWYRLIRENRLLEQATEVVSATIIVNLLILPYSWSYNLTLLLIPASVLIRRYWQIGGIWRWAMAIAVCMLFVPMSYLIGIISSDLPHNDNFYCLLLLGLLILFLLPQPRPLSATIPAAPADGAALAALD